MKHIRTDALHPQERQRYWESAISDLYTVTSVEVQDLSRFYGRIAWRKLGDVLFSDIATSRSRVRREDRHIKRAEQDIVQINFQLQGKGLLKQDGRSAMTHPGEIVLYDSARPYEMCFDGDSRQISVDFPRHLLTARCGHLEHLVARPFPGSAGAGRFLYSYVANLVLQSSEEDSLLAGQLQEHFFDLLLTAFASVMQDEPAVLSKSRAATLTRLKIYLTHNLNNPELTPGMAAQAMGISLRTLHSLFEHEEQTVWNYIQYARLDCSRADIENLAMFSRSLSDIGFSWGFNDAAHFSRAFRRRFGMTPSECRAARKALLS
ncbi:helix-turn-helix domain-containing protein [Alcaligenes faecalis]|uniref:AraC-like ligand-binding domain-containing protein n=1 Tax=Alcaligenes faecalis TaxID=511 RepID=UPI001C8360F6|nr:helix-turn-helix domain-containing protein [Alcaligenes faecalis]MBX6963389.1 helix-turn-helix domain-containing protein [Providencia rettgeri]MBX7030039.1 helix-turn-helix domain-containing protein [Alcaligenes faecalis]